MVQTKESDWKRKMPSIMLLMEMKEGKTEGQMDHLLLFICLDIKLDCVKILLILYYAFKDLK